jgi:hypothetical protein
MYRTLREHRSRRKFENVCTTVLLNYASPVYRGGVIGLVLADDGGVGLARTATLRLEQHKNKGVPLDPPPLPPAGED